MISTETLLPTVKLPKPNSPQRKKRNPLALWDVQTPIKDTRQSSRENSSTRSTSRRLTPSSIQSSTQSPWQLEVDRGSTTENESLERFQQGPDSNYFNNGEKFSSSGQSNVDLSINQDLCENDANTRIGNTQYNSTNIVFCESEIRNSLLLQTVTKMEFVSSENIKETPEEIINMSSPAKKLAKTNASNANKNSVKNQQYSKSGDCASSQLLSNLKSTSCTDLDSNTKVFFNEKGWPVKIMRLTEDSPPKAMKPWPSRSSTVVNKSPKKEKSGLIQKKPIPKSSRENKENSRSVVVNKEIPRTYDKEPEKQVEIPNLDLELKSALNFLDETIDKYASDKNSETSKDNAITKNPQNSGKPIRKSKLHIEERKLPKEESKACSSLGSARSNKYDSKEMKKYIQTKRLERKIQMSEEVKKKQETMEMQRKNLEKLKAKAHLVLKKSALKHTEEIKPKWQGPLEEDSEILVPGIHIFDSKIPAAKKSKLSAKSEKSSSTQPEELEGDLYKDIIPLKEVNELSNGHVELENTKTCDNTDRLMDYSNKNVQQTSKATKKLRLSDKSPVRDPNLVAALAQAVSNSLALPKTNETKEEDQLRKNIERLSQSPKFANGWDLFQLTSTDVNKSPPFKERDGGSVLSNFAHPPMTLFPPPVFSPHESNDRKRHQIPPPNNGNLESKKLCTEDVSLLPKDVAKPAIGTTLQEALMDVQAQVCQKENPEPEWMKKFIQPDPYRIMNIVKMKMLSHQKKETIGNDKRERLKQKVISRRSSIVPSEDETDAPSIESMEEDFKILPDPLRLSDMNLPTSLPSTSFSSPESSHSSPKSSKPVKSHQKLSVEYLKSSVTSYNSGIPPLFLPESIQHLKLQSSISQSDFSSSMSYQQSSNLGSLHHPETEYSNSRSTLPDRGRAVSPAPLSSTGFNRTSTSRSVHSERVKVDSHPINQQIEIGQVLSSAALRLQFHAELSRLDAFDQSLAQVIATEQLYHMAQNMSKLRQAQTCPHLSVPGHTHLQTQGSTDQTLHKTSLSDLPTSQLRVSSPPSCESDTSSRSQSRRSSLVVSEHLPQSVASEQVLSLVSEHLPSLVTSRTMDSVHSSLYSIQEALSNKETKIEDVKDIVQKQSSPVSSISTISPPTSASPKNLHFLKVMIEDAEFQRKQHQLLYKTQEDLIHAHYKAAITELEFRFSALKMGTKKEERIQKENDARTKIEEQYKTAISSVKEAKNHVLANWSKRIDSLKKQREHLKKVVKNKPSLKLRSAESSPKKMTPLRSGSMTSVVESSSSSEMSVANQAFEDKKRVELEKEKAFKFSRRKLEKELLKKYQEEVRKMQEIEKEKMLLTSVSESRSRRDKSTSPLESVLEATHSDTRDVACSAEEDKNNLSIQATSSLRSVEEARTTDVYNSESFESPESSETPRQPRLIHRPSLASKPFIAARSNSKSKVLIKVPLSPRLQFRSKRRCSSGSDESILLSQNETQSEQSDYEYEVRILALKEQKRQRSAELNRLHRELKRVQREQQKATEESLIKQIQVYDSYISQTKRQLEELTSVPVVKPQIKHPRVSDKFLPRNSDVVQKQVTIESKIPETATSDVDTNSLKSISEASSTETTIQSSGQAQVVEDLSQQAGEDASKNNEESEILQIVETEESNSNDTQSSIKSEISIKKSEESIQNVIEESEEWVDAEEFFSQIDDPEKNQATHSKSSKASVEESVSPSGSKTSVEENISQSEGTTSPGETISSESVSKSEFNSQEIKKSEENVSSEVNEETTIQLNIDSGSKIETPKEESSTPLQTVENHVTSEQLDVGSVVSIISQAPSSALKTKSTESQDSMQNVQSEEEEADISTSVATSSKSIISELISAANTQTHDDETLSNDSILISQLHLEGDENNSVIINHSDVEEETLKSSDSDMIKVFVSNKKEASLEESSLVENDTPLDKTYILNKTYTVSKSHEDPDEVKSIDSKAELITNYILGGLLRECFGDKKKYNLESNNKIEMFNKNNELVEEKIVQNGTEQSVDYFTQIVLDEFVHDATDCVLKISESKKAAIISSTEGVKSEEKETEESENSSNKLLEALALEKNTILIKKGDENKNPDGNNSEKIISEVELSEGGSESEGFWLEEEVRPVSLQAQREAEELRLKQLQIEQEIKQLEQAQEHIPSYYYVREIPNKPPPPYTPPGQSSSKSKDSHEQVPDRQDTEALVTSATQALLAVWRRGESVSAVQPPQSKHSSSAAYKRFLFDLVKQTFTDISSHKEHETEIPPWEKTGFRMKRLILPNLTEEFLSNHVMKKVRILLGYEPNLIKENLIIQWSRKKRDRVDELLVRESQEEEQEWTDYSKCEVAVKNNVALSIFDSLLEDTTSALCNAFLKKLSFSQQNT